MFAIYLKYKELQEFLNHILKKNDAVFLPAFFNRFQGAAVRIFVIRYIKIGAFPAYHSNRQILAGLATADGTGVFPFDQAAFAVSGGVYRITYYFVSFGRIIFIEEPYAGNDIIGTRLINGGAGTFNKYFITVKRGFMEQRILIFFFGAAFSG